MRRSTQTLSALPAMALACAFLLTGHAASAQTVVPSSQDTARVISSVPVIQQVAVPRQVCTTQQVTVPGQRSGAGAAMGAIAGGAIGNSIGESSGRAAATLLGLVGGAMLGDRIEGGGAPSVQNVQQCTTQTFYENRTIGYNVVYEYAGKQYQVQLPQDPGPTVRIQITPVSELPSGIAVPPTAVVSVEQGQASPVTEVSWGSTTYAAPAYAAPAYVAPAPVWQAVVPTVIVGSALYWGAHSWGHRPYGHYYARPAPRPGFTHGHWGGRHGYR